MAINGGTTTSLNSNGTSNSKETFSPLIKRSSSSDNDAGSTWGVKAQHLVAVIGLFAVLGMSQYGTMLKPYASEFKETFAAAENELINNQDASIMEQRNLSASAATPTKTNHTDTTKTTSSSSSSSSPPATTNMKVATTALESKNNTTTPTTIVVDEQKEEEEKEIPEEKKKMMYLMNCHRDEWGLFVRTELYHIFGGLIYEYGWEELAIDDAPKLEEPPAVILYCENNVRFNDHKYNTYQAFHVIDVTKLRKQGTKIAIYNDDTHVFNAYSTDEMKYILNQTDVILSSYAYLLKQWWEDFKNDKTIQYPEHVWIPHSASPSYTQLDFNTNPARQCFWSGAEDATLYPMRAYLKRKYIRSGHRGWTAKGHPGYGKHSHNQTASYAQRIHRHYCGLSTTMSIRRLVAKSFEVPATGALLIVNMDLEPLFKVLGFEDRHNYVGLPNNDPDPTIEWVLDSKNYDEIDIIRKRGMELIRTNHTTAVRAKQIQDYFTRGIEPFPHHEAMKLLTPNPCPMTGFHTKQACEGTLQRMWLWHHFKPKAVGVPAFNTARRRRRRR